MSTFENLYSRRSIRNFTGEAISRAELVKALKVPEGMAPCCAIALGKTEEKYTLRDVPENRIKTEFVK